MTKCLWRLSSACKVQSAVWDQLVMSAQGALELPLTDHHGSLLHKIKTLKPLMAQCVFCGMVYDCFSA